MTADVAAAALALLVAASCGSPSSPYEARPTSTLESVDGTRLDPAVASIADDLLRTAELRTDLAAMRVHVTSLQQSTAVVEGGPDADDVALRAAVWEYVRGELVFALSDELNVLDGGLEASAGETTSPPAMDDLRSRSRALGATHVLLADIDLRARTAVVTARLVDARSALIVATARGVVSLDHLATRRRVGPIGSVDRSRIVAAPEPPSPDPATEGFAKGYAEGFAQGSSGSSSQPPAPTSGTAERSASDTPLAAPSRRPPRSIDPDTPTEEVLREVLLRYPEPPEAPPVTGSKTDSDG